LWKISERRRALGCGILRVDVSDEIYRVDKIE
jgi:hypothetical protein